MLISRPIPCCSSSWCALTGLLGTAKSPAIQCFIHTSCWVYIFIGHPHALKTYLVTAPSPNTFKMKFKVLRLQTKFITSPDPYHISNSGMCLGVLSYLPVPKCTMTLSTLFPLPGKPCSVSLAGTLCSNQVAIPPARVRVWGQGK